MTHLVGFFNLTCYIQGISITLLDNYYCHGSQLVEWVLNSSEDVTKCQSLMDFRYVQICALISHVFELFCAFIKYLHILWMLQVPGFRVLSERPVTYEPKINYMYMFHRSRGSNPQPYVYGTNAPSNTSNINNFNNVY